jgi:hypothetical protein
MDTDPSWSRVAGAVAEVRERFGEHSVEPARLLGHLDPEDESDR